MTEWYLHMDLDAFFASVEQLDNPDYRGKPVIVGGLPDEPRSVVSTASYEARKFGVHSAMPTAQAYRLCPHGIYVHGRYKRYEELSSQIMQIFARFSPEVEQMSIDEAFINLTGTEKLFGPPEETAMKIKKAVKDETGLTVSAGLAASKYFAKVSSGLNKPDGFYFMKPGSEQNFMLSQSLDDIWGIGKKTSERIKSTGIRSVRELYQRSRESLVFMFGDSTGNFLYNIIRGNPEGTFESNVKTHSISAERTFPVDVTDYYANETSLLELAHSVMFRLLRENKRSRTVFIKIRYEDFTTITARQTFSSDIITLDSFYEKLKALFHEKYQYGRGVRLLGAGFDNVQSEEGIFQQDLFDDAQKKRQAVEKAILKVEKKYPDIQIQKARTLQNLTKPLKVILFFAGMMIFAGSFSKLAAETVTETSNNGAGALSTNPPIIKPLPEEAPQTLFSFDVKDSNVEFLASGYWLMNLTGNVIFPLNPNLPFAPIFSVPVFKQEVDLSAWIMINKRWYFETSFKDEFNKNTIAFGFQNGKIIKSARLANRGITFPAIYSSEILGYSLAGGDNQAPGFSMSLAGEKWRSDFVLRYDLLKTRSAVFYGMNEVADIQIPPAAYITGKFFTLPEEMLSDIKDIYVENTGGSESDKDGRKYKKLNSSQFFIIKSKNTLVLSEDALSQKNTGALPTVLVTLKSGSTASQIAKLGSYTESESFLGKIQNLFCTSKKIELEKYSYNLESALEGEDAIVIQSPNGFSPFINAANYDLGLTGTSDLAVISKSTEEKLAGYSIFNLDDSMIPAGASFLSQAHSYATVASENATSEDFTQEPILRFPFADTNPEVYLNQASECDAVILCRTYTALTQLKISTEASAGSVQVYINGVLDSGAVFDKKTGNITLSQSVNETDKIYITWSEESEDIFDGAIAGGAGFLYTFFPGLSIDTSLTARWALSPFSNYATSDSVQNGFVAIATGISFEKSGFEIKDSLSAGIVSENTTGTLFAWEGASDANETFYLSYDSAKKTTVTPRLNARQNENLPELDSKNNFSSANFYGISDSSVSGAVIPLEFDFSSASENEYSWAAVNISLSNGDLLLSGSNFNIGLKSSSIPEDADIYLQLGINAEDDKLSNLSPYTPTWKISDSDSPDVAKAFDKNESSWQVASVFLTDVDKARFTNYHDARIIVVQKRSHDSQDSQADSQSAENGCKGKIFIGPYETEITSIEVYSADGNIKVKSQNIKDSQSISYKNFNRSESIATKITWENSSESLEENSTILAAAYFKAADFSHYEKINIPIYICTEASENKAERKIENSGLKIILDRNAGSITEDGALALKLELSPKAVSALIAGEKNWQVLNVDIFQKKVFIGDTEISSEDFSLYINENTIPSRIKLEFDCGEAEKGEIGLDSVYYSGLEPRLELQNYFYAGYKKEGDIWKIGNYSALSDAAIFIKSRQKTSPQNPEKNSVITANQGANITVTKIKLAEDFSLSTNEKNIFQNAGHSIESVNPLFKTISVKENFRYNPVDKNSEKYNEAKLDFDKIWIPLSLSAKTQEKDTPWQKSQNNSSNFTLSLFNAPYNLTLQLDNKVSQNISQDISDVKPENYFETYADSWGFQFSTGEEDASERKIDFVAALKGKMPFIKLEPSAEFETSSLYKKTSSYSFKDNETFTFKIPFTVAKQKFTLQWQKKSEGVKKIGAGGNYISDLENLGGAISNRKAFFAGMPIYDLFDENLSSGILQDFTAHSDSSLSYDSSYGISWKRPLLNSLPDLFIPLSADVEFARKLGWTDTKSDYYQLKTDLANSAVNLFGSKSKRKPFNWYETDEFTSSVGFAMKIPRENPSELVFSISAYTQTLLFISSTDSLKGAADFTLETNGDWQTRETFIWTYGGTSHIANWIFSWFIKDKENLQKTKAVRKESFNMQLGMKDNYFYQNYELSHNCEAKLKKEHSVFFNFLAGFAHSEKTGAKLTLEYTVGGKMQF